MLTLIGDQTGIDHLDTPSGFRVFSCESERYEAELQILPRAQMMNGMCAAVTAFYVSPLRVRLTHVSDTEPQWRHICEVCGVEEILTPGDAFDLGWDYPPRMGQFGVVGPRCCPRCPNVKTVWWALVIDGYTEDMLTEAQRATVRRIAGEPKSIAVPGD